MSPPMLILVAALLGWLHCLGLRWETVGEPVKHVGEHLLGNVVVEFFNLLLNVMQEGIAGPATNHHDEENWATPKEHWCQSCELQCGVSPPRLPRLHPAMRP